MRNSSRSVSWLLRQRGERSRRLSVARNSTIGNGATNVAPQLVIRPGLFGANPVQEEVDGSLSMPLLGFWLSWDAVEREAFGMPEHKIEEHVRRKFRVIYPDLTAGRGLTQYT